jgi:hypothetical protein
MEFLDLLCPSVVAILAIFIAVSSVVFVFLRQRGSLAGHGDAQLQKTVIYPVVISVQVVFIFLQCPVAEV